MRTVDGQEPSEAQASWYRISVSTTENLADVGYPLSGNFGDYGTDSDKSNRAIIWQIAEITSERQRQEESFGKLQEIIDYLDQAPAGFFSADDKGRVDYLNGTLCD